MRIINKNVIVAALTVCALSSSLAIQSDAALYQYTQANYWYYSDDLSFRYSDFGADEDGLYSDGAALNFNGLTPAGTYESGKTSYNVSFDIDGESIAFNVMIGLRKDADMNGVVNIRDAAMISRYATLGNGYQSDFNMFLADADKDGKVSVRDAALIARDIALESSKKAEIESQAKKEKINRVVELVNIERKKEGLNPLTLKSDISVVSAKRAREIEELFSHKRPNGTMWYALLEQYNINCCYGGENIAAGYDSPEGVVEGWMNSEGHRENILDPEFTQIGIGYYCNENSEYKNYWVQTFVKPF